MLQRERSLAQVGVFFCNLQSWSRVRFTIMEQVAYQNDFALDFIILTDEGLFVVKVDFAVLVFVQFRWVLEKYEEEFP